MPKNVAASDPAEAGPELCPGAQPDDFGLRFSRSTALERVLVSASAAPRHRDVIRLEGRPALRTSGRMPAIPSDPRRRLSRVADGNAPERLRSPVPRTRGRGSRGPDGLVVRRQDSVQAGRITEDADYEGVRVTFTALPGPQLGSPIQIDIGFGDAVTPRAGRQRQYPTLLPVSRSPICSRIRERDRRRGKARSDREAGHSQQPHEGFSRSAQPVDHL